MRSLAGLTADESRKAHSCASYQFGLSHPAGLAPTALMLRSRVVRVYSLAGHFGSPNSLRIFAISRRATFVGRFLRFGGTL